MVGSPPPCSSIPLEGRHQRGVYGKLGSVKEGQPVHDNLQPPCVCWIPSLNVKVPHHDICRNTSHPSLQTCAAARSSANPLAPRTPASAHAARWWPRQSRRRPHRQVREEKGGGRWRRRHNKTRNGCGSIRVDRDVGKAINALHASGPFWDRHSARRARQRRPHCPCHSVFVCGSRCRFLPTVFGLNRVLVVLTLSRAQEEEEELCDHVACFFSSSACLSRCIFFKGNRR